MDSGVYALVVRVHKRIRVAVGALGQKWFAPGIYLYVGRAHKCMKRRIARHFSRTKRLRWHIDYLTANPCVEVLGSVILSDSAPLECQANRAIQRLVPHVKAVPGFGNADCRAGCESHLWWAGDRLAEINKTLGIVSETLARVYGRQRAGKRFRTTVS